MKTPPIVSPQEWNAAREELLVEEKKLTRARDALAAKRRRMPWMAVEKEYRFDGPEGPVSLLGLFEGRVVSVLQLDDFLEGRNEPFEHFAHEVRLPGLSQPRADVQLEAVTKAYGDVVAVDDLALEVGAGEFFTMLGPSGSGKTTTLRLIAGFEIPDKGRVLL